MPAEGRGGCQVALSREISAFAQEKEEQMQTKIDRIRELSKENRNCKFVSLYHLINEQQLLECYWELDPDKAGGKRYIGKIKTIGYYKKDGGEIEPAIYIDTSKTETSYSGEVVMVEDITYLYDGTVTYRQEAVQDLIDILLDYRDKMEEEDRDKVGKIFMGLWNLATQEK